jgi:hypothetical protein
MPLILLDPFLRALWKKKEHGYLMQNSATTYTANYSINVFLNYVFDHRLIARYRFGLHVFTVKLP